MNQLAMEQLRLRWHTSVNSLVNELSSQCCSLSSSTTKPSSSTSSNTAISCLSNKWLTKIEELYNEPHRAYHNMNHIMDVLSSLDLLMMDTNGSTHSTPSSPTQSLSTPHNNDNDIDVSAEESITITTLAAFFHDVIYNPQSSTNEKDSAILFIEFVTELYNVILNEEVSSDMSRAEERKNAIDTNGNSDEATQKEQSSSSTDSLTTLRSKSNIVSQVEQCIIATATHISSANTAHQTNNILLATFLDADMSILGKESDTYNNYAGCIRKEYEFVTRNVYCEKRSEILESFLPAAEDDHTEEQTDDGDAKVKEKKVHRYIYATEKGRQEWEAQARENLNREIDMLRRGVIPCEK